MILYSLYPFKVFGVNNAKIEQPFKRSEISKLKLLYYITIYVAGSMIRSNGNLCGR